MQGSNMFPQTGGFPGDCEHGTLVKVDEKKVEEEQVA